MINIYNKKALKRTTSLTINADLLQKAKEYKINLSDTLEKQLIILIKEYEKQKWLKENKKAIIEYNNKIDSSGIFSDTFRKF